jgi:hypothetical protein
MVSFGRFRAETSHYNMRARKSIFLAFAFVISSGRLSSAQELLGDGLSHEYDRFRSISTASVDLGDVGLGVQLRVMFTHVGTSLPKGGGMGMLMFLSSSSDGWKYLKSHDVACLADDQSVGRMRSSHDGDVVRGAMVVEAVLVELTRAQLRQIAHSRKFECAIGSKEIALTQDQMATLHKFVPFLEGNAIATRSLVVADSVRRAHSLQALDSLLMSKPKNP